MEQYQNLLRKVINTGVDVRGRNGIVRSLIGQTIRYNLMDGFPLLTTKKMPFEVIKGELLGFLRAYDHVEDFKKLGCNIWNLNADHFDRDGDLGPIYGVQWRKWYNHVTNYTIDQLQNCIDNIKKDPFSRRHIVNAWNPAEIELMCLPPCHVLFQFHVYSNYSGEPGHLSLSLYQRSGDMFLGVPFNIASYSLLLSLVAKVTQLRPLYFIHHIGDAHLYQDHFDQAYIQLEREPYSLPELEIKYHSGKKIDDFGMDDIILRDYKCHGRLKAKMIV